jgi:methylmalonyl-CoA mutase N-terminal domain/subunit
MADAVPPRRYQTLSGIPLKIAYRKEDVRPYEEIGDAGQYPFTRGVHETMYRGKLWTMRMFAGFGTPEDINSARRIWARTMRERFKAKNPRSWILRTHAQTAGVSLTAQQPLNNVVRTTIQALAAVLGGTQSLHTNSYDETYALPTEEAATLALRTQQIIAEESGVASVTDPLGGSYFVERLTDEMEERAMAKTTLGEVCDVFRQEFGEHHDPAYL